MTGAIIGIDPGKRGGLSILPAGAHYTLACCREMPMTKDKELDVGAFRQWVTMAPAGSLVVIEQQLGRRMQGVSRAGVMMREYGRLLGLLFEYDVMEVKPKVWQAAMIPEAVAGETKKCSIEKAQALFPDCKLVAPKCRTPHDGMSDALLIAEYGYQVVNDRVGF